MVHSATIFQASIVAKERAVTLAAVGHLGWDVLLDETTGVENCRTPGGSLLHFANGYTLFRSGLRLVSATKVADMAREVDILTKNGAVLNSVCDLPVAPCFDLTYSRSNSELVRISARSVPPFATLIAGTAEFGEGQYEALHLCSMPFDDQSEGARVARSLNLPISVQLHWSILPDRINSARWLFDGPIVVFCSRKDIARLILRAWDYSVATEIQSRLTGDSLWVITSKTEVVTITPNEIDSFSQRAISKEGDPTGAGDAFAGAFCALDGVIPREMAIRLAMEIGALAVTDHSTQALVRLLESRSKHSLSVRLPALPSTDAHPSA